MSSAFGKGPSNGQFWFGGSTFPGFMFKKNVGVGGRRSTKMNPGGNITCNSATYLYNKYTPGASGIGASSMSNRRAKNRSATVCRSGDGSNTKNCFPCHSTLGQYSNYTHNPNGFVPCISLPVPVPVPICPEKIITIPANIIFTTNAQLGSLRGCTTINGNIYFNNSFVGQPDFSVFDCLTIINGDLMVEYTTFSEIYGFAKLTKITGIFYIGDNINLTSIPEFNALINVIFNFTIQNNPKLTLISGFTNLTIVGSTFIIVGNALLTSISGFNSLKTVIGDFYIQSNNSLISISGFLGLNILSPSTGSVTITSNNLTPLTTLCQNTNDILLLYFPTTPTILNVTLVTC